MTGNQIAARADEYEAGKEDGDGDDSADASEDGIITCKASVFLEFTLLKIQSDPSGRLKPSVDWNSGCSSFIPGHGSR